MGHPQSAGLGPPGGPLCLASGGKGRENEPIVVQQHVDHVPEAVWFLGREEAAADLVHGLLQLRQAVIVLSGIVPVERWGQTSGSRVRDRVSVLGTPLVPDHPWLWACLATRAAGPQRGSDVLDGQNESCSSLVRETQSLEDPESHAWYHHIPVGEGCPRICPLQATSTPLPHTLPLTVLALLPATPYPVHHDKGNEVYTKHNQTQEATAIRVWSGAGAGVGGRARSRCAGVQCQETDVAESPN